MSNTQTEVSEHDAIAKTIQHYIDGACARLSQPYLPGSRPDVSATLTTIAYMSRLVSRPF